jgi:hypothetical protein
MGAKSLGDTLLYFFALDFQIIPGFPVFFNPFQGFQDIPAFSSPSSLLQDFAGFGSLKFKIRVI